MPRVQLPELVVPGRRLGRSVNHDPRSLRYLVEPATVAQTKIWERRIPVLDQGDTGSCTGNATIGALGTGPLYDALTPVQRKALDEAEALRIYSLATQLDPFPGTYPPDDSGSDGLSAAKAAQKLGYLSGYKHITSVAAAQTAILSGPFIVGTNWLSGMDEPDGNGVVKATGTVRGGHEYECHGFDADADLWWFYNSWGTSFGVGGRFAYSSADFARLLADSGDATVFVPNTQPAPVPTPTPTPVPTPTPTDTFPASVDAWAQRTVNRLWASKADKAAAHALIDWRASHTA